jgi:uncharacterized protein (DUF697 family)
MQATYNRQQDTGDHKGTRQRRSCSCQKVCSATATHGSAAAASATNTQSPSLGALQEHHADKDYRDQNMNDQQDSFHSLPNPVFQTADAVHY